eukprot:13407680-Heterocapsa_arctica.AAC.1
MASSGSSTAGDFSSAVRELSPFYEPVGQRELSRRAPESRWARRHLWKHWLRGGEKFWASAARRAVPFRVPA